MFIVLPESDDERERPRQLRGAGRCVSRKGAPIIRAVVVVVVVRVEEARRNNAASMTPTAVANVICKPKGRKKGAPTRLGVQFHSDYELVELSLVLFGDRTRPRR